MQKMLLINTFITLNITSLVASAALDKMYKEMQEITKNVITTDASNDSAVVKVDVKKVDLNLAEANRLKAEIEDIKIKIENRKAEIQQSKLEKAEIIKLKTEIIQVKEDIAQEKIKIANHQKESDAKKNIVSQKHTPTATTVVTVTEKSTSTHSLKPVPKVASTQKVENIDNSNIHISIPKVPEVPKVPTINGYSSGAENRTIQFSKRVPPGYTGPKFGKENIVAKAVSKEAKVGEVNAGKISAYLRGELLEVAEVEKRLKEAGFTILSSAKLDKKGKLVSVVFTNKELITMASKPNRGFASTLRVLVNQKEKQISITNPLYLLKGFLQDDFDKESATKILSAITSKFDKVKNSGDALKFQLLPKYQFMSGLPYYKDSIVVATGDNLVDKLKKNKRVFFEQKLENGSTVVGVALNKRTNGFLKKIGSKNAGMLPLLVLIEDGKATILDPKFYISIMYPRLTMSEFMKIATIPDAMVKDSKRVFR